MKTFLNDISPLFVAYLGIELYTIHEVLSITTLSITSIYTCFKLKNDFFNNKNKNEKK